MRIAHAIQDIPSDPAIDILGHVFDYWAFQIKHMALFLFLKKWYTSSMQAIFL
jgi:hypothetical protein